MSKNPFLFVFSAFLFVSASLGVSSAYAADSGDGLQFCFYEDKEGNLNYPRLNFSQKTENDTRKATEVCFDKWYEANPTGNGTPDANTYLNNWLSQNDDDIVFVRVTSDIKFAGRSIIGCAEGNNAFNGKMITLYSFQTLYSQINPQTNEPYVISGLCHFGNVQIVAFIEKFSGTMYSMNFDDAYLNASATNSSAGIIAEGVTGLDGTRVFNGYIHDVKVSNSEFQGTNVGAIVGKGNTDISSAELHSVKIVGNSNTNSYVGGIIGDNTVRCLHADQGNVHPCSNAKNNGKSAGPFVLENVNIFGSIVTGQQSYVGGIAGSITLNVKQEYHDISIKGLRMNGSTYAGGLFGQVFYDGSDDETVNPSLEHKLSIHDVSIEHGSFKTLDGVENGFIRASLRAGGLIGYCDVGNNANNTEGADVEIYNVDNKIEVRIDDANNISAGGIIGNLMNSSNETTNLSIYNTNTEGDVIGGSDSYKMGYLVGEMVTSKINLKQITDNTHYGANDYVAAKGIGSIDPANWLNPPAPINATGTGLVVKRNFRNEVNGESAQTSLVADGSLKNSNDGYYIEDVTTSDKYANGVLATAALNQYQNNTGSSEGYLFCVKIPTNKDSLYLKQISGSETAPDDYTCYDYWYNTSSQHDQVAAGIFDDASSRIQYWLDSRNDKKTAHVVVESDLHFAGRNVDGTCKTAKNEYNQLLTFSRHYQSNYSYTKGDYTIQGVGVSDDDYRVISGLCYVTEYDSSAGFFRRFEGDMSKLAFDNAYFKTSWSNNTKSGTGIIASGFGSASIKVTNSEFHGIAAGAVFGRGGGELTNVVVEKVKVDAKNYAGGLIGYWDNTFKQNVQIELAKVEADVDVSGTSPIYAGALIGYLGNYGSTNVSIKVANTYSKGNVTGVSSGATLGYLIGAFNQHDIFEFDIDKNYHYGTDDELAKLGIGSFDQAEWLNPSTSATSTIKNGVILRNFRNAVGSLEVDGDLRYALKPIFKSATESYFNGVISSEQMISFRMAAVLNMDAASEKWTMVNDENDHLPIFVGGSNAASNPVYAISFDYESFNTSADESSKKILSDAIADGKRTLEYIPQYPDGGIVLFTDAEGFLNDDDIAFVKSLMNENGFWYNSSYPKLDANQSYTSSETYTYKKALVMNVAVHVCSDNGNSGCIDGSEVLVPKEGTTWNGYSIDFNGEPLTEYTFNYIGGGYPMLVMSDFSSHLYMFYSPYFYHINSKNAMQSSIHKAVLYNFEELLDGLTANEKNDLESGTVYNDTIHLYYVFNSSAPEYKFPVENKGTSPVVVKSFLENANGMGRKQVYEAVIDANETVNVPLMRTAVAPTDLGYSLEWNAEFGLGSVFSGTHDVISTENDYIASAADFYNNSYTKSWMVTGASGKPLTVNDSVYMDSIVTAISTTSLANHLSYNDLKMVITPTVTQLHYDLVFAIPEDMRDADIYVSNKKNKSTNKLELDWFDKLDDVTADVVSSPVLLNSDGCLINWKLEGSSSTHAALDIQHELQYLTSKEENSLAVNTLVPDIDNPACPSANVTVNKHTIQLNRDGDGDLFAVQKLPYPSATTQGAIDTIVLKHSFKKDANDKYYLDVPVTRDADGSELGIKLSFKANAMDGNLFKSLLYDDMTGVAANFVPLLEGENIDMKSNLKMKVEFIELVPVYVIYNLSLTSAADSAKTYLPADASSTATLEMVKVDDEIEFWSPYRTDVCFAGWSNVKAESFTDNDPLWSSLNSSNYADFSNDQDHPTALYAIWRECPITLPMRAIALKSGLEHATLVVYQPFGKDSLRHVITDESVALAGIAFDFYVDDVRTKAEAGYSLDNTSFKVSYVDPATSEPVVVTPSEDAWRLIAKTLPQTTVYSFTAKVTKDEYKLVFNDNSAGEAYFGDSWTPLMTKESFAEDANKNWNVSANYNVESADTKFPLALYRKGLCMSGYTFDVDDNTNGVYTELDEPFIDKLKELGKDLKKPITLYAYWSQCQTLGVEVELADSDKGSYTFTRKFDLGAGEETQNRSYTFDSDKMFVPSSKGDISFTGVTFTIKSGAGVVLDATAGVSYRKGSEWNDWTSSLLTVKSDIEAIGLSLLKSSYEFAYDMNAPENAMVFVNPSIKKRESYTLTLSTESEDLQSLEVLGRTDACLVGWALDAKGENVIKAFNIEALRTLEALEKASKPVGTLYAVWKEKGDACAPKTFKVATNWSAEEGVFTISYKYENKTYKFDVTEDGVEIPAVAGVEVGVSFAGSNAYQFDDVIKGLDIAGNLLFSIDKGHSFTVSDAQSDVQLATGALPTEYAFEFNANAGDANVFAGTEFAQQVPGMFYAYNQDLPMDLYRADAELVGWSFKSDVGENDFVWQTINDRFIEEYEKFVMQYGASFGTDTLYAVWKKKSMKTYTVTADSANKGSLTFTQNVGNTVFSFVVPKTGLKVPATDDIEVTAHFDVINSWSLDEGLPLVWTNAKGKKESTANDVTRKITGDVKVTALATFKEIHLVFDIPSDNGLFYGDDWSKQGDFDSDDGKLSFPTLVYDTDRCLAGWSIKSESGSAWTDLNERLVDSLYKVYPTMNDLSNIKLYARWTTNADECAGNITKATVELEHGDVQLVEKKDKSTLVHKFNNKGTMMLPAELDGKNWTLKAIPDSSYTLDSLVVMNGKKVVAVLKDGDKLPKNMENATLKAYFGKANKTPVEIVNKHFSQSGNTICVNIKASEFEVTRGVSAKVEIIDLAKDAVVVDTLLTDSAAMAFSDEITLRMLQPGKYKVRVVIGDDKESDEYSQEFTVDSQVASLKADRWQMVSLTAVDTSLIQWDEGVSFYWWDESRVGDFWQYHAYKQGDEIDASRGIWVSSKHEGSLVMRKDFEDDGKDIVWNLDSVTTGWNLIANPHGWYVDLFSMNESTRKDVDEESEISFWQYNCETGEYKETRYLAPYEAAWVKVSKKMKWNVSAEPVYVIHSIDASKIDTVRLDYQKPDENANNSGKSNAKSALAKVSTANRWTLQAVLSDKDGKRDSWNILGVGNKPFVADEPPTSMGDHVNLSIVEGSRSLAKSIKSASDETEWTLELSASDAREGYLALEGIDGVESLGYHVYVTIDGVTTEMHEGKPLQVSLKSSTKKATVRVARSARVVAKNVIKGLRSSQVGNQLHVSFDAPESLAGERTKVELLDVKGKLWATESAKAVFGTNAVSMNLPKQGIYILRVRVGSQQQAQRILVK